MRSTGAPAAPFQAEADDSVGGETLAAALASLRYGGGGGSLGQYRRRDVWARLGGDFRPPMLDELAADEVGLDGVPAALECSRGCGNQGRTLVRVR